MAPAVLSLPQMERATKLLVVVWAAAALILYVWLLAPSWPRLTILTFGALSAAAALTAIDRRAVGAVLIFTYVFPALISISHGVYHIDYDVIWIGALLGAMIPDGLRTPWHIPAQWRGPLVFWALAIAVSTMIVLGREIDFYPRLLAEASGPRFAARWILHSGLALMLGILWFDWLFGASLNLNRAVVTPLVVSCVALASVSIYQTFFDFSFLNMNVFGGTGRASGTTFDANVSGSIAAFWTAGAILWAASLRRLRWPAIAITVTVTWIAVWASGSRTALAAASVSTAFGAITLFGQPGHTLRRTLARILGVAALATGIVLVLAYANTQIVGPARRMEGTLPGASVESLRWFAWQMWDRYRYGSIATEIIRDFPWFGVGIGSFQFLLPNYTVNAPLAPDNAQNWYRHQLAEFGLVGSIGWIAWLSAFAWFVVRPRARALEGLWAARGMLIGFAAISFVGMPSQSVPVAITFWTVAFWFVELVGIAPAKPLTPRAWAVMAMVVVMFAAGSAYLAATDLRLPVRAQRAGRSFSYGFYYPEPDGSGGEYRWARQRASAVIDAATHDLVISVWVNHRDIEAEPVDVKVWVDGELAIDTTLRDTMAVSRQLLIPSGQDRIVIDTWVSRTIRPADFGVADSRELGLMVKWVFFP